MFKSTLATVIEYYYFTNNLSFIWETLNKIINTNAQRQCVPVDISNKVVA